MADKNTQVTGATVEKTQVLTAEEQKKLKEVLQEFHPLYRHYLKSWKMYLDSYRGGAYVKGYIYKHIRESDQSVTSRRNKSVYPNYIRPIVGLYLSYIFRRTINRKVSKEEEETENKKTPLATEVAEFWDNCDMRGTPINKYMKNVGTLAKIFGHVAMIVDMPAPKDEEGKAIQIKNEAERKKLGIRPYLALYTPVDIVNWEVDSVGNLDWIRFYEELPMEVSPFVKEKERQRSTGVQRMEGAELAVGATPVAVAGGVQTISAPESVTPRAPVFFSRKGTPIKRYTTWTKTSWYIYEIKREKQGSTTKEVVELVDSGDHNLGEVPVVFVYHEKDTLDATVGLSFLQDIAPLNILIMNWLSLLDEEICQKTLNILTMQGDPGAEVTIGSNNVLTYEGDQAPGFIAPAATPGEMMLQAIEKARDEIYRLAKLTGGVSELKEMRSGVAFSYSFQETETTLADTADELEAAEEKVHNLWYRWMDAEWSGIIDYPDEFGIEDVLADLKVLENSMAMVSSPTFKIEVEKKIADKILPKADKDMLSNIFQEITDLVMEEMENLKAEREAQIVGMQQQGQVDEEGNPIETNKALKKDKKLPGNPKVGKTPLSEA